MRDFLFWFAAVPVLVITFLVLTLLIIPHPLRYETVSADPHLDSIESQQHLVMFRIHPEREGQFVTGWISDDLPVPSGYTDNESKVVLSMIPGEYYMYFGEDCFKRIAVTESSYEIWCDRK